MSLDPTWVPMKWPCGPLEMARRKKSASANAELNGTLEAWSRPAALELLKGTPVNCLIVAWAYGEPEDSAQQQALKPLLEAGRTLGIRFVGKIATKEGAGAAVAAGRAAGLSAVMLGDASGQPYDLPVILQFSQDKVAWEVATPIFSSTGNAWPGLRLETMEGDTGIAGPTGVPWVDSNGWFSLLAHELTAGKALWLDCDPPASSSASHPANYGLAIADSRAYGSRWIVSLDDKLRAALVKTNSQAMEVWGKLCETLVFFERHRDWQAFRSQGVLAVISDFRGDNASLSQEVLNLLNRRQVQFLIVERARTLSAALDGLKAILWLDEEAPTSQQRSKLFDFVRKGEGLVITAAYWGPPDVKAIKKDTYPGYALYNVGKGLIAVTEAGFQDPYQVAVDAHLLVSRRNDLVRLYNPASTNCRSSTDPGNRKRLVQILNYSANPADLVTLWMNTRSHSARLWWPESKDPLQVQGADATPGTEFGLPPIFAYCALEFEGSNPC
ncbi:MAG TPA: hypothetical protein VKM93_03665 [Terriglobia bacterium]|nr:hypothetical protein [Terriglobia bacterium]